MFVERLSEVQTYELKISCAIFGQPARKVQAYRFLQNSPAFCNFPAVLYGCVCVCVSVCVWVRWWLCGSAQTDSQPARETEGTEVGCKHIPKIILSVKSLCLCLCRC